MTSIRIGSVSYIGAEAFYGCSKLSTFSTSSFPPLATIGENAFYNCSNIKDIYLDNVKNIGQSAFYKCTSLTSVSLSNVLYVDDYTFYGCTSMSSLSLGNKATFIGSHAFENCSSLNRFIAPSSLTTIKEYAFYGCNKMTILNLSSFSSETIGDKAFANCSALKDLYLPNYMEDIVGTEVFADCKSLSYISWGYNRMVNIPSGTFKNCSSLTGLAFPNSVTSIGDEAFSGCSGLTSITFPSGLKNIGSYAFSGSDNLTSVTVKFKTPLTIGNSTFGNVSNTTLHVPQGCKEAFASANYWRDFGKIEEPEPVDPPIAFADAIVKELCVTNWDTNKDGELTKNEAAAVTTLGSVFKGSSITSFDELQYFTGLTAIETDAFYDCSALESVTIPNSVTSIERFAFPNCTALTSVVIPEGVTTIGYSTFDNCSSLATLALPVSLTTIEDRAFSRSGLTSMTIPSGVTNIGTSIFASCKALATISVEENNLYDSRNDCNAIIESSSNTLIVGCKSTVIPTDVTVIGSGAFLGCSGLTSITIPPSVESIGNDAFSDCSFLQSIAIPEGVTVIGSRSFQNSGLTSVSIPATVTSIGSSAFDYCYGLVSVTVYIAEPLAIESSTFMNRTNARLFVPVGSVDAYKAASYWKDFKEIKEIEVPVKCATPTISYKDGKLHFECETEGVEFHVGAEAPGLTNAVGNNIALAPLYTIRVYATKAGCEDSDVAEETLDLRGLKGDVNQDGVVSITDAVSVVNIILVGETSAAPAMEEPTEISIPE